jgi:DNA-directed RNA polymerase subunit beta
MYAEVNDHGFIESPYRVVKKNGAGSLVTDKTEYLSADDEDRVLVAQASTMIDEKGAIAEDKIRARVKGDFPIVDPSKVDYIEVSPNQILSVAAALIPFLEHDDAKRALMGSNMQRQSKFD